METRSGLLTFERERGNGPRTAQQVFNFNQSVSQAVAILTGSNFGFSPNDDRHLGKVITRLETTIDDDVVTVTGSFGVRDWSGDWDDNYEGSIPFLLLADLDVSALPSNLLITGAEFNQATQFFRSQLHLDPANAKTDNSIPLISGKNTVMRVYVDTQHDSSRPTITKVSGTLEIRLAGSSTWTLINPSNGPITPIADGTIRRVNRDDTLNFLIPGAFSTGNLEYRIQVFDAFHKGVPGYISGRMQGVIRFTAVSPLRIRGIAVHYTGKDAMGNPTDIPAPTLADLRNTLTFVSKTYPVGQVFLAGFQTIDDGADYTDTSGDGCGNGWDGLLNKLQDMQGDSQDIYFGLIPSSVPRGWGGCGGGDGRVAAAPVGATTTSAQEIAHAFDRDHAPCPPEGQPGAPDNQDSNYPTYDGLMSGSIGEYGMDDAGSVQDAATVTDFMSYCGPNWVSPYTYLGLLTNFPVIFPSMQALSLARGNDPADKENLMVRQQHLFLDFRIYHNGDVMVRPSFHYISMPVDRPGMWTPYSIELRDSNDRILVARRITNLNRHKGLDNAWLDFRKQLPFPKDTAFIVFTCGEEGACEQKEIERIKVPPEAPTVQITSPQDATDLKGQVKVAWEISGQEQKGSSFYSLVRYSNNGGQTWQTVAPRTTEHEMVVDLNQLPGGEMCMFQVLVTSGIRTGAAVSKPFRVPRKDIQVSITSAEHATSITQGEPAVLFGEAFSPDMGSFITDALGWSSDLQGPLGIGNELNLSRLEPGVHMITLSVQEPGGEVHQAEIQVEVQAPVQRKHSSRTHPGHHSKDHDTGAINPKPEGE